MTAYLVVIVVIALVFDFINGFHDAANSIATVVSTRVLSPRAAVVWAAAFNFIAFLVYPSNVSSAIAKGVELTAITNNVILATLVGAIAWNLITWWSGLPVVLVARPDGRLRGRRAGAHPALSILNAAVFGKIVLFIVLAPLLGMLLGWLSCAFAPGCSPARARRGSTASSDAVSWSRRRSTRSGTAATTPRRPWASSRCC